MSASKGSLDKMNTFTSIYIFGLRGKREGAVSRKLAGGDARCKNVLLYHVCKAEKLGRDFLLLLKKF